MYGSFSYFSGKIGIENLKLLSVDNFLKFFIEKKSLKPNVKLQLLHVSGSKITTSYKKIQFFNNKAWKNKKKSYARVD